MSHKKVLCIWKKIIFLWILNFNKHFILYIALANEKNMGKIARGIYSILTLHDFIKFTYSLKETR